MELIVITFRVISAGASITNLFSNRMLELLSMHGDKHCRDARKTLELATCDRPLDAVNRAVVHLESAYSDYELCLENQGWFRNFFRDDKTLNMKCASTALLAARFHAQLGVSRATIKSNLFEAADKYFEEWCSLEEASIDGGFRSSYPSASGPPKVSIDYEAIEKAKQEFQKEKAEYDKTKEAILSIASED